MSHNAATVAPVSTIARRFPAPRPSTPMMPTRRSLYFVLRVAAISDSDLRSRSPRPGRPLASVVVGLLVDGVVAAFVVAGFCCALATPAAARAAALLIRNPRRLKSCLFMLVVSTFFFCQCLLLRRQLRHDGVEERHALQHVRDQLFAFALLVLDRYRRAASARVRASWMS